MRLRGGDAGGFGTAGVAFFEGGFVRGGFSGFGFGGFAGGSGFGFALRAAGLQQLGHRRAELGGRLHRAHASFVERTEFVGRGALATGDDRARVAHALARRRRDAGDVRDHRLRHVILDERGCSFFIAAADFADEDDAFGLRIALEQLEHIHEVHAAHRIATDTARRCSGRARRSWSGTPLRT